MEDKLLIIEYIDVITQHCPSSRYDAILREALDYCLEMLKDKLTEQ